MRVRVFFILCAIALCLAVTSCHPAGQDFQECFTAASHEGSGVGVSGLAASDPLTACMTARGWRSMRPHAEPGPSGWARIR